MLFFSLLTTLNAMSVDKRIVEEGLLDISDFEFKDSNCFILSGYWEFYWDKILTPEELKKDQLKSLTGYFEVPKYWKEYKGKTKFNSKGSATYRAKIILPQDLKEIYVIIPEMILEYRVYINGKLVRENGFNEEKIKYKYLAVEHILLENPELEIVVNIRNSCLINSGIENNFRIGNLSSTITNYNYSKFIEFLLIIFALIAFISSFIFWIFNTKNLSIIFFSIFSLSLAIRTIVYDYNIIIAFETLSYFTLQRIFWISNIIMIISIQFYGFYSFEIYKFKKLNTILLIPHFIYIIISIFFPLSVASYMFPIGIIFAIISVLFLAFLDIYSIVHYKNNPSLFSIAIVLGSISFLFDILFYKHIAFNRIFMSIWYLLLIMLEIATIFLDSHRSQRKIISLSKKLHSLNKTKDDFLKKTYQELQTPINGIIGISSFLIEGEKEKITKNTKDNLKLILRNSENMKNLINNIADYSRLKNNDIKLNKSNVNICKLVNSIFLRLEDKILIKDISFISEIEPQDLVVWADKDRLTQILYNLINNSIRFTKEGFIKVYTEDIDLDYINICIQDTGSGFSKQALSKIEKIPQEDESFIVKSHNGSGLGLSISKKLIELHGGKLYIKSNNYEGSIISFPIKKSSNTSKINNKKILKISKNKSLLKSNSRKIKNQEYPRILIVDDDINNILIIQSFLSFENFETFYTTNENETTKLIKKYDINLVLLNSLITKSSQNKLCLNIKETFSIPIILLTSEKNSDDLAFIFETGASDYLRKPIDRKELLTRVNHHINFSKTIEETNLNKKLANTDSLTGLYNRRYIQSLINLEFNNTQTKKSLFSIIMIDIDDFKKINDTYGHNEGDKVLKTLTNIMIKNVREIDTVSRYGGEEFLILLPNTDLEATSFIAERIRKATENSETYTEEEKLIKFTISLGITECNKNIKDTQELINIADKMLYESKSNGKNRVSTTSKFLQY